MERDARAPAVELAELTSDLTRDAKRACALADTGEVAVVDVADALRLAMVMVRSRLEPALDPAMFAEPALHP